jgi:hypothetical protein
MTTKEEVLKLAEESGFDTDDGCAYLRYNHDAYANVTQQITKLINLAKAQGAAEEREACALAAWNHYMDTSRKMKLPPDVHNNWCAATAIRNRERK